MKFVDGDSYLVTFNNGRDCVEATYVEKYRVFSHLSGSVSVSEAEKVECVTTNIVMPTQEQYTNLAENLNGLEETFSKALESNLKELGLDPALKHSSDFLKELEERIFCCEWCDTWKERGVRVFNEYTQSDMCEECDDKNQGD